MWNIAVETIYLFLPAYIANMAPVIFKYFGLLKKLDVPIDGGTKFFGKEILGPHKTLRGVIAGVAAGMVFSFFQFALAYSAKPFSVTVSFPFQTAFGSIMWGFLLGAGAIFGDILKSFVKRRLGIAAGRRWFPWDQLDMVLGGIAFGLLMYSFSWTQVAVLVVLTPLFGLLINLVGYGLRIKEAW